MMRTGFSLACAAMLTLGAGAAAADCREELAQLTQGISKDGSLAPMQSGEVSATPQEGGDTAAAAAPEASGLAKDGSATPLEVDPNVAMSAEDAQAQSTGGDTAAAQAAGATGGADHDDALARAQAALDSGDEAGCMAAVNEAKGL